MEVFDPWANASEVKKEFGISLISETSKLKDNYDAIVLAVSHKEFSDFNLDNHTAENSVVFDVKSFFPKEKTNGRL